MKSVFYFLFFFSCLPLSDLDSLNKVRYFHFHISVAYHIEKLCVMQFGCPRLIYFLSGQFTSFDLLLVGWPRKCGLLLA